MSLEMMSLSTDTEAPRRSALESLAGKFETAAHGSGMWVGAEESEYIAKIFHGYAELVDKLNGVWIKNE